MTYGYPHVCDPHSSDISRLYAHERTEHHINARCSPSTSTRPTASSTRVSSGAQSATCAARRSSPVKKPSERRFFDARGWERPQWYKSNEALTKKFPEVCAPREHEWDARWWSPIINAEHLQMRESVGMVDLTAFNEFDITGPGALDFMQKMTVNNGATSPSAVRFTPRCSPRRVASVATSRSMRLGDRSLPHHHRCLRRWSRQLSGSSATCQPTARSASKTSLARSAPSVCGVPRPARSWLEDRRPGDLSNEGFPYGAVKEVLIDGVPCIMFRISYVGELGWEIYTKMEHGLRRCGTRSPPPVRNSKSSPSASACTPSPVVSRRATA